MAHFLPSRHRVLWPLRASRYRVVKELVNYRGVVKFIEGSGAVRVCQTVLSCLGSRNKSKKCDKQLTHIVRVISRCLFILQGCLMYLRKYQSRSRDFFLLLSEKSRIVSIISDTLIKMGMKYIFSKERTSPSVIAPIEVMPANTAYKLVL